MSAHECEWFHDIELPRVCVLNEYQNNTQHALHAEDLLLALRFPK